MASRIAVISDHASPLAVAGGIDSGGQNIYVASIARHVHALGYELDVFTRRDNPALPEIVEVCKGLRIVHVRAGRKALYLASHASHIVGLPLEEGRALLAELTAHATQPQFVYRHDWRLGDLVAWDNLATMHRGTPFDDTRHPRDMRRTTVLER